MLTTVSANPGGYVVQLLATFLQDDANNMPMMMLLLNVIERAVDIEILQQQATAALVKTLAP